MLPSSLVHKKAQPQEALPFLLTQLSLPELPPLTLLPLLVGSPPCLAASPPHPSPPGRHGGV